MKITPEIQNALRRAIAHYGNASQFARKVGIAHSTILFWLNGKTSNINGHLWNSRLRKELKYFLIPEDDIPETGLTLRESPAPYTSVPLRNVNTQVSSVSFAEAFDFDPNFESGADFAASKDGPQVFFATEIKPSYFAIRLDDGSQAQFLPAGAMLLIGGGEYPKNQDIVAAKLRGEKTIRLFQYEIAEEMIRLHSLTDPQEIREWKRSENTENLIWIYPVLEINVNLIDNFWQNGTLIPRK